MPVLSVENIVNILRENIKDVSITTDVIVGFPGETEEEFNKTYEFLKRLKLTKTHIFKYSPRKGTRAADMPNQLDGNVKEERSKLLIELNKKNEKDFISKYVGREMDVLVEQEVKNKPGIYEGYTRNYLKVEVSGLNEEMKGQIVQCKITVACDDYTEAEYMA